MRTPSERPDTNGAAEAARLAAKLTATSPATTWLSRAGGMMTARNMPKSETLSACTTKLGRTLPTIMPRAAPPAHPIRGRTMVPRARAGRTSPLWAMFTAKISSVLSKAMSARIQSGVSLENRCDRTHPISR